MKRSPWIAVSTTLAAGLVAATLIAIQHNSDENDQNLTAPITTDDAIGPEFDTVLPLLLSQDDIPELRDYRVIPNSRPEELSQTLKKLTLTPSECGIPLNIRAEAEKTMTQISMRAGQNNFPSQLYSYQSSITQGGMDLQTVRALFLGTCSSIVTTLNENNSPYARYEMHTTEDIAPEGLPTNQVVVLRLAEKTQSLIEGANPIPEKSSLLGYAYVNNVTVTVKQEVSGQVDKAAFDRIFSLAVHKAAQGH